MELPITAEEEAYLLDIARHLGKTPLAILTEAALCLFDSDRRFRGTVVSRTAEQNAGRTEWDPASERLLVDSRTRSQPSHAELDKAASAMQHTTDSRRGSRNLKDHGAKMPGDRARSYRN